MTENRCEVSGHPPFREDKCPICEKEQKEYLAFWHKIVRFLSSLWK